MRSEHSGWTLLWAAALVAGLAPGCTRPAPRDSAPLTLGLPGQDNAEVDAASRGSTVVLAWAASKSGLGTQVFAAVSTDAGRTFGEPRRVDDGQGVVRVSGEQPPRVAIGAWEIAVLWTAKQGDFTEIRAARSSDGGRTFGPSASVHQPGLTGARGWASLAFDGKDRLHALWLDGRNEKMVMPGGSHASMSGAASAGQHVHSPRQDLYHSIVDTTAAPVESQVADHVCFCCKTAIVARPDGSALAAWRHIFPNSERDIGFAALSPAGDRAGEIQRVSMDRWELDACPDDGPSMVVDARDRTHIVWPTLVPGEKPSKGIFYTSAGAGGRFGERVRLDDGTSTSSSHPHVVLDGADGLAVVWDVPMGGSRRVILRRATLESGATRWAPQEILPSEVAAYYPVIAAVADGLVVAWTSDASPNSMIVVQRIGRGAANH